MLDDQLTFRRAIADLSYLTSANAYNYGQVASIAADANITDAGANTGFKILAEVLRNPHMPIALFVDMPGISLGGGMTTANAPTNAALDLTLTFSDDGSATVGQSITARMQSVAITANAGVLVTRNFIFLPPVVHSYIKVAWATTFTGGASPTAAWGPLGLYGMVAPSNLIGTDMTNRG
jgi:hypothetical protein